ncbi:MAG: exodeoxyribonuclease V subunit beta [Deltaproteobacteria bacterium]|nr:exodeoxyribonuclease V subunit beta [Deltaproteobacteria bacterium]
MKNFDLINTPLSGINLIEASAGTGKTYAITGLFLRLILEKDLLVDQILVVTFTKAATAELKEKIRNILLQTEEAFLKGSSNDGFIDHIVKKAKDPAFCIQLIENAIVDFDKASIFSIHGFCQRILQENAFETGSLFDTELLSDQLKLNQEVADDFWRRHFYDFPLEFIAWSIKKLSGPIYFLNLLEKIKSPEIKIIPDLKKPSLKSLGAYRDCLKNLKDLWPVSKKEVEELLKDPSLKGNVYKTLKPDEQNPNYTKRELKIMSMFGDMDRFTDPEGIGFPLFKGFENFTASKLKNSVKKNHTPPDHKFFDICDELYSKAALLETEMENYIVFLKVEFFRFAKSELSERKRVENIQFFNDLLITVKEALESKGGKELEKVIRKKYKAALVDEFQDTDPVQYEIFKRIFSPQNSMLFMIGDSKQAIYSFRGADIFSYMKAAGSAEFKYTLTENWRSEARLIKAINTIFSSVNKPFIFDAIPFEKVKPAKSDITDKQSTFAPLILWYAGSDNNKPIDRNDAALMIAKAVTGEIVRLLSSGHGCEHDCFRQGDIAVLVRTNEQARIIKESLSARRIHSVLYSNESIFESQEAMEIERILLSISQPGNDRLLRAALVTDIMGVHAEKLDPEKIDILWWEKQIGKFDEYCQQWNRFGFIGMFRLFMVKEKARIRLLSFVDGQRRLTNVLHLAEILHGEAAEKKLGMTGLLKWLSEQISSSSNRVEEYQLRLESDEDAVKIVTIHKCKGLEYRIVFCPFVWGGSLLPKGKEFIFHDKDKNRTPTFDLDYNRDNANIILAQNELLAENLRLLYVALTRAKTRCYLAWGNIKNAGTSALAYLFHYKNFDEKFDYQDDIVGSLKEQFISKTNHEILSDLKELAGKSDGSIELDIMPFNNGNIKHQLNDIVGAIPCGCLFCRKFSGKIDTVFGISSFSSLTSGKFAFEELPDRDSARVDIGIHAGSFIQEKLSGREDIFSFPKGARAGIFFHDIFEHLDFASKDPGHQKKLIKDKLKEYSFEQSWLETVCNMIKNVLSVSLKSKGKEVILSSVKCDKRINEMEFYFPLNYITPQKLKKVFSDNSGIDITSGFSSQIEKLYFSPSEGFMKGYIDTIFQHNGRFYIVDWKSNFLGTGIKDYARDLLRETIKSNYYNLQYYIYTLALHQYLRWRMPKYSYENDFGGVFYIFIRGVDSNSGPEFGIFNDVPKSRFIEKLGRALIPDF